MISKTILVRPVLLLFIYIYIFIRMLHCIKELVRRNWSAENWSARVYPQSGFSNFSSYVIFNFIYQHMPALCTNKAQLVTRLGSAELNCPGTIFYRTWIILGHILDE